jgi:hypothetical protein
MKTTYRVKDPAGIVQEGRHLAAGELVELPPGGQTAAWRHFGQIEEVEPAREAVNPTPTPEALKAQRDHINDRRKELLKLNRKQQEALAVELKVNPKGLKEQALVDSIIEAELKLATQLLPQVG